MSNPVIQVTSELTPFLGKTVGFVKINKPSLNHNASYECAAWWEDSIIQPGVYALTLEKSYHEPKRLQLSAKLKSIVSDDYFASLWCGNPIGDKPYKAKHIGEERMIHTKYDIIDAIQSTGNSPDGDHNLFVNPFIWDALVEAIEKSMLGAYEYLNRNWSIRGQDGDGPHFMQLSAIEYAAKNIAMLARAIEQVRTQQRYIAEKFIADIRTKNVQWAIEQVR